MILLPSVMGHKGGPRKSKSANVKAIPNKTPSCVVESSALIMDTPIPTQKRNRPDDLAETSLEISPSSSSPASKRNKSVARGADHPSNLPNTCKLRTE